MYIIIVQMTCSRWYIRLLRGRIYYVGRKPKMSPPVIPATHEIVGMEFPWIPITAWPGFQVDAAWVLTQSRLIVPHGTLGSAGQLFGLILPSIFRAFPFILSTGTMTRAAVTAPPRVLWSRKHLSDVILSTLFMVDAIIRSMVSLPCIQRSMGSLSGVILPWGCFSGLKISTGAIIIAIGASLRILGSQWWLPAECRHLLILSASAGAISRAEAAAKSSHLTCSLAVCGELTTWIIATARFHPLGKIWYASFTV